MTDMSIAARVMVTNTAICADDKCPWKYRGLTVEATLTTAERHVADSSHAVTVYEECRTTLRPGPESEDV